MREFQKRAHEAALISQLEGIRQRRSAEFSLSLAIQFVQRHTRSRLRAVVRGVVQHRPLAVRLRFRDNDIVEGHVLGYRIPDQQQVRLDVLREFRVRKFCGPRQNTEDGYPSGSRRSQREEEDLAFAADRTETPAAKRKNEGISGEARNRLVVRREY